MGLGLDGLVCMGWERDGVWGKGECGMEQFGVGEGSRNRVLESGL